MADNVETIPLAQGGKIAYRHDPGKTSGQFAATSLPGILFCGGFHSDMDGTKAGFLDGVASELGCAYTRFDYRGHGRSSGRFDDGAIGDWYADTKQVLDEVCIGPQVVVGSSMGGWMAMLLARDRPDRVAGLVLIAPAPDFPKALMWPSLPGAARAAIERDGVWHRPSEFEDEDYPITKRLIEESTGHHLLDGPPLAVSGPVRIMHGARDETVPLEHARRAAAAFDAQVDVRLSVVPEGDHRLSRPADLALLADKVRELVTGQATA